MNKIISEKAAQISLLPFWDDRKKKSRSIFFIIAAVFILTFPYSIYSIFLYPLLRFPTGLVFLVNNKVDYEAFYWNHSSIPAALMWILYIGMAAVIVRSNKKMLFMTLYVILILILILNVAGCHIIAPGILSEGF